MIRDALVVGINNYEHLQPLKTPAKDAEAIAKCLGQNDNFRVWRVPELIDPFKKARIVAPGQAKEEYQVRQNDLEQAIARLFLAEGRNIPDTALFYFSGHGLRKPPGTSQEGYLATCDSNPNDSKWGFSLSELRGILEKSRVRQQIIWLDCCYSGELINLEDANPGNRGSVSDRCFIAACREFEESWSDIGGSYGALTKVLVEGLDRLQQQYDTVDTLLLTSFIDENLKDAKQRPVFYNLGAISLIQRSQASTPTAVKVFEPDICPYKGLEAFGTGALAQEDHKYFFGRTKLTNELIGKICDGNFLAVLGPSGSGKSSVVRAGLLHELQQGTRINHPVWQNSRDWKILVMRPGESPIQSLAAAFVPTSFPKGQADNLCGTYTKRLKTDGAEGLKATVEELEAPRVVLLVDQFEEIFTRCQGSESKEQERQQFFECLLGSLDSSDNKLCVIITMRADFLGKCAAQEYAGLAKTIQEHLVTVTPMTTEELREVIAEPAKLVGLEVEEKLVTQMTVDVKGSPGSLPLLEFTLTELWRGWHEQWQQLARDARKSFPRKLTCDAYNSLGGIEGTLRSRAERLFADLAAENPDLPEGQLSEKQEIAKRIFIELTQLGEEAEDTRRQVKQVELLEKLVTTQRPQELVEEVIQTLATDKLIVTGEERGEAVIDIVHETLIRHWTQLKEWIDENRDPIRIQRMIEAAAENWRHYGKGVDNLLRGAQLTEAENFIAANPDLSLFSKIAREFLRNSTRSREIRDISSKLRQHLSLYQQQLDKVQVAALSLEGASIDSEGFRRSVEEFRTCANVLALEYEKISEVTQYLRQKGEQKKYLQS